MSIKGNTVGTPTPRSDWAQTDPRKADYIKNKTRDIGASRLNNVEKAALATVNGEGFLTDPLFFKSNNLNGFATWVYRQAGVNVSDYLGTVHSTFGKMFDLGKDADGYRYRKLTVEEGADPYSVAMLLEGSYSGKSDYMQHYGYQYTLELKDYKVGDIFCMRYSDTLDGVWGDSCYYMALYQAENTFILYQDYGPHEQETNPSNVRVIDYDGLTDIINNAESIYYYVLRPENIAIMPVMEVEERLSHLPRALNISALTEAEETAIVGLGVTKGVGRQMPNLAVWAYAQAGIDVSAYIKDNISSIYWTLFPSSSNLTTDKSSYLTMLVPESYGGTKFQNAKKPNYALDVNKYHIGDIFCGKSGSNYWAAIYQGNEQFMLRNSASNEATRVVSISDISSETWEYYFVLRPENIAIEDVIDVAGNVQIQLNSKLPGTHINAAYGVSSETAFTSKCLELYTALPAYTMGRYVIDINGSFWFVTMYKTDNNYGVLERVQYQSGGSAYILYGSVWAAQFTGWTPASSGSSSSGMNREFKASPNTQEFKRTGIASKFYILTIQDPDFGNEYSITIDYMSLEDHGNKRQFTITRFYGGADGKNNLITVEAEILPSTNEMRFKVGSGLIKHICGYY